MATFTEEEMKRMKESLYVYSKVSNEELQNLVIAYKINNQ